MNELKIKLANKIISQGFNIWLEYCPDLEFRTYCYKKYLEKGTQLDRVNLEVVEFIISEGRGNEFCLCDLMNWDIKLTHSIYRMEIYSKVKQEILDNEPDKHFQNIIQYCIFSGDPEFFYFFIEYGIFDKISVEKIIYLVITLLDKHIPNSNVIKIICDYIFSISGSGEHFYKVLLIDRGRNSHILCVMIDSYYESPEYCTKIYNYLQSNVFIYFSHLGYTVSKENFIFMSELITKHKLNFLADEHMIYSIINDSEYLNEIISRGFYKLDD